VKRLVACSIKNVLKRDFLSLGDRLLMGNGKDVSLMR